jgi:hypothetical protein
LSDNVELASGSGGAVISTDEVTPGIHTQRVKVQFGTDGNATDASSSNPLPVTVAGITGAVALPTGAATASAQATQITHLAAIETAIEGTLAVSAASLPLPSGAATAAKQPALGTAGSPSTDVITVQGHASGVALKVDGSAVTQPVSVASLPLPSGAATSANQTTELAHLAAIETAVEGTLTVGTHAVTQSGTWVVRCQDGSGNALTSIAAGSERAMSVAIVDGSGSHITSFGGGTQYTEGDTDASITGTAMLWEDTGNTLRPVASGTPLPVAIISGAGSGGTASQDGSVFTPDTTNLTPVGGYRDDTSPATVTEGDAAAARITEYRALHVNLRDASGNELAVGGGTQYDEDTAHSAAEKLTMAGVVRADSAASLVGSDGDRTSLIVDSSGRLHVNVGNTVTVGSHAVTNAGTFAVQAAQSGTWTLGANSGVDIGDVTINNASGASAVNIQDGGNSITVDNAALSVTGGGVEASALRVTLATDSTGVLSVDDNGATLSIDDGGGTITVDGTVSISGTVTVDTELPAAAALADNTANPTAPAVGAFGLVWDGATWDRMPGTSADGVTVNLAANNDVTVTGSVTANAGTNLNTSALALESGGNLAAAATSLGLLDNAVSGNELQVDIVAALPAGTNNIGDVDVLTLPGVAGDVAHDASDSGNPIKVGFKAANALPTAVANGDRANGISDLFGRQLVASIDPGMQTWKSFNATTTQSGTDVWSPASGKRIAITSIMIGTYGTTAARLILWFGDNADTTYSAGTDQLVFAGSFVPSATATPGAVLTFPHPIFCTTADRELHVTTDAGMSFDLAVYGFEW